MESDDLNDYQLDLAMMRYLEARRDGVGPIVAARAVSTTAAEIERFARMNPAFQDALDDAVAESIERVEAKIMETAQDGDFQAGKLVLETQLPTKWTRPDREMIVRLSAAAEIDVDALHKRLAALDVPSEET